MNYIESILFKPMPANYHSSDTFQGVQSTLSNGYNLFPSSYMSKGVGGKRNKKTPKWKKGGDCGCSKANQQQQPLIRGGRKQTRSTKKNRKSKKSKQ